MGLLLPSRKLIRRRGPFAFPGIKPGFDPSHIAASTKTLYSGIAMNAGFVNVLAGGPGTPSTSDKPTAGILAQIGPVLNFPATGLDSAYSVSGDTSADILTFTMAAIVQLSTISATAQAIFRGALVTSGNAGIVFDINATTGILRLFSVGGTVVTSAIALVANVPYFVAASNAGASNICTMIAINLLTGVVQTFSGTGIAVDSAPSGNGYVIGNRLAPVNGLNSFNGAIAAVAFTNKFMPLPQLAQWATDPWGFWYPR